MTIHTIKLPDVGEGVAEAELGEWLVSDGDVVAEDEIIGTVVTDKAAVEIPSPVAGRIVWICGQPGDHLAVGAEYVKIDTDSESTNDPAQTTQRSEPLEPPTQTPSEPAQAKSTIPPQAVEHDTAAATNSPSRPLTTVEDDTRGADRPLASPAVRRRARELAVELRYVTGRGPAGRITHEDLDAYLAADYPRGGSNGVPSAQGPDTSIQEIKVIGVRRMIAQRMQLAKTRIPHFTYVEEIDMTRLEELRHELNTKKREEQPKLTLLPFLMCAMVKAIRDFPMMNTRFDDDNDLLRQYGGVHIGIAVQTSNGLMVPVAKHVETYDIWQCASEVQRLADTARDGSIGRDELTGSTITATSLGALGGIVSTPVINYPEVAIIAVNKLVTRPVFQEERLVPRQMMNLSSSFDHRVIDGSDAAQFIQRIKGLLEFPTTIFMET